MAQNKKPPSKKPPGKRGSRNPVIKFNKLAMYFGEPYVIDLEGRQGRVVLKTPTMEPIINLGYEKFFSSLKPLITNTTEYKLPLYQANIDWCEMSDFELFCSLKQNIDPYVSALFFEDDLDIAKFVIAKKEFPDGRASIVLLDEEKNIEIDEEVYFHISQYLREVFKNQPEEKITKSKELKEALIEKEKMHIEAMKDRGQNEVNEGENSLMNCISAVVNHPGFKYKHSEIKDLNVCQFFDSVNRIQVYETSTALMKGMYSGFVDGSKIDKNEYNFMRAI